MKPYGSEDIKIRRNKLAHPFIPIRFVMDYRNEVHNKAYLIFKLASLEELRLQEVKILYCQKLIFTRHVID